MTVETDVVAGGTGGKKGSRTSKPSRCAIEQNVLDSLVYRGIISLSDVLAAVDDSKDGSFDLETVLLDRYHVPKDALGSALSDFYQCPYLPYDERTVIDADLLKTLNLDYLRKNLWLPITRRGSLIDVLTSDPHDLDKGWDVRRTFPGMTIRYAVGLRRDIEQFLNLARGQGTSGSIGTILGELVNEIHLESVIDPISGGIDENDSAIVRLTNQVIVEADRLGASDIHIEPYADRKDMAVRLRIDGTCSTFMKIPATYRRACRIPYQGHGQSGHRGTPQTSRRQDPIPIGEGSRSRIACRNPAHLRTGRRRRAASFDSQTTDAARRDGICSCHVAGHSSHRRETARDYLVCRTDWVRQNDDLARDSQAYQYRRTKDLDGRRSH